MENAQNYTRYQGLYQEPFSRSNCGVGVLMNLDGQRTHQLIEDGFTVLKNLEHRGARGAEKDLGDGAGILLQKPHEFLRKEISDLGDYDSYGVGQLFLPQDAGDRSSFRLIIEDCVKSEGFRLLAWRRLPTDNSILSKTARESEPVVVQIFVQPEQALDPKHLDTKLYILRRVIENAVAEKQFILKEQFYICSLDRRKIVYKGLLTCDQLPQYFKDLVDPMLKSSLVMVHSRFSTNTLGAWRLAHPYRTIIHNGEINTIRGNLNWMRARESDLASEVFGADIKKIRPVTGLTQSDTAVLDNVLELLIESGRSLPHALRLLVPEAWQKNPHLKPGLRDWYDFHSTLVEPWDGPALIACTDGEQIGAILDRNGLRPARYYVTSENQFIMASEVGVLETAPEKIVRTGRLKPGQLLLVDPERGGIVPEKKIFSELTDEKYGRWLQQSRVKLSALPKQRNERYNEFDPEMLLQFQRAFGYTLEDVNRFIREMAAEGKDPIGAMGNDTPLSVLSNRSKTLFSYFKQLFAQVSNPPIDYMRENLVTSLESHIGRKSNMLGESPEHCRQLNLYSPILTNEELHTIRRMNINGISSKTVDATFESSASIPQGIRHIREEVIRAIEEGYELIILSDRNVCEERLPIPSLLVIGGVHHHLIRKGLRSRAGLILETGDPTDVHHFCTLIGYGADAINPYLAYASVENLIDSDILQIEKSDGIRRYKRAVEDGLLKVMAKMGISTLESYKGAQIFEIIGLNHYVVDEYFAGTVSRIEGIGLKELEEESREHHQFAFGPQIAGTSDLDQEGEYYWRRDGEYHQWNPITIATLQHATRTGQYEVYKDFARQLNHQTKQLQTLRGMLEFGNGEDKSIPLDEVEPEEIIVRRFFTSSMSFGSLSKEAHETLAIAMNRIGGRAGSGEGGEKIDRFGTERECKIKQVASGRFGVSLYYLKNATDIEIKMAQGSKPGEGGHLPGKKVNEVIAEVRYTTPGVGLISPPPHHDIYSIEDLSQLIQDLKCANPEANIHVKLVAGAGVGTIAAGVAKAKADAILISGQSGGTGASAKTSIKSAGIPWELGLAEANQILRENNLRSRVRLRVDGGLKTGRDVIIAALLGAEEFGFGTAALVVSGCVMLRKCHANTCSVGIATQDPELRKRFTGKPEHIINYMYFIAREVREYMASLGFRRMDELIGKVENLRQRSVHQKKARLLDLSPLLYKPDSEDGRYKQQPQNHNLKHLLDNQIIKKAQPALHKQEHIKIEMPITSRDRTMGTRLSSEVVGKYGKNGLPDETIQIRFTGSAGQSFGAFLASGITMHLEGDSNDYVGKGLSGGKLIVSTPPELPQQRDENTIIGNVALYGGTTGEAYINGGAGERFAVRNSGVLAVVEGVGDHGCEYMTGGAVVILGRVGKNFGAGMSGGEAFVYDPDHLLETIINPEMVRVEHQLSERDLHLVKRLTENHHIYTSSRRANRLLLHWEEEQHHFVKVIPPAFEQVVQQQLAAGTDIRIKPPALPLRSWILLARSSGNSRDSSLEINNRNTNG